MDTYISHESALRFWDLFGRGPQVTGRFARTSGLSDVIADHRLLGKFEEACDDCLGELAPLVLDHPVDVSVGSASQRRNIAGIKTHLWAAPVPAGSFVRACDGLWIATPEFALCQIIASNQNSSVYGKAALLRRIYDACGLFTLHEIGEKGWPTIAKREQICTVDQLQSFAESSGDVRGVHAMSRLLEHARDRSRSPMETSAAMQLCLARKYGGYSLERMILNYRLDIPWDCRDLTDWEYFEVDLCDPASKTIVECDSDLFHTGSSNIAKDAKRRNVIDHMKYKVYTLTSEQMRSPLEMKRLAEILASRMGVSLRTRSTSFESNRRRMRQALLPSKDGWEPPIERGC